jgi:3-methyladenine DNA glycosylase/8-oxoguanine DNA glycosylase
MLALGSPALEKIPVGATEAWRATGTPDGPATVHLRLVVGSVEAEAWGRGADWLLERVPDLIGLDDDPARFDPPPGAVRDLHRRAGGLRLGKTARVFEAVMPTVLAQLVAGVESKRSYRRIVAAYGEPAPGPQELRVPPTPETIARLDYSDLHRFGVERKRASVLIEAARRAKRLEAALDLPRDEAYQRLQAVRGVGPWTAAYAMGIAWGDHDAVPVGDYNLPNLVSWALAGEPRGNDDRMLELLEPYRGHRRRVLILLKGSPIKEPRYGPRVALRDIESS